MEKSNILKLRIHGDNILECERALTLVAKALEVKTAYSLDSPIYAPVYEFIKNTDLIIGNAQLFPGHNRWGLDIQKILKSQGAPLREATDAIVTRITKNGQEEIIFGIEFCNALPAGNNAWQRTGRALTSAYMNIPFIQISEIGGLELGKDRKIKAARFPNPIIPFSYIAVGKNYNSLTMSIYISSPSSTLDIRNKFSSLLGEKELIRLIRKLIFEEDLGEIVNSLTKKNLDLVNLLATNRKRKDTLIGSDWSKFLTFKLDAEKFKWLEEKNMKWTKKSSGKVPTTTTFKELIKIVKESKSLSVGGGDIPICMIPSSERMNLANRLELNYNKKMDPNFLKWIGQDKTPLIIVWITGFKPKGDDSRPDRGLVPLARMLLGPDIELLTIVYGPGKNKMWESAQNSLESLADQNGLWESIVNLSDAILIDSYTNKKPPFGILNIRKKRLESKKISLKPAELSDIFSEHDVDSVIHFIFSRIENKDIFESMCNPPGGDWSGLSILDFKENTEYRWTSLPRVSENNGKRPDHVIEISLPEKLLFLSIESKDKASDFVEDIGDRLNRYTKSLIESIPNIARNKSGEWNPLNIKWEIKDKFTYLSGGAFCYKNAEDMDNVLNKSRLDFIIALEFKSRDHKVILHFKTKSKEPIIKDILKSVERYFPNRLEVQIH